MLHLQKMCIRDRCRRPSLRLWWGDQQRISRSGSRRVWVWWLGLGYPSRWLPVPVHRRCKNQRCQRAFEKFSDQRRRVALLGLPVQPDSRFCWVGSYLCSDHRVSALFRSGYVRRQDDGNLRRIRKTAAGCWPGKIHGRVEPSERRVPSQQSGLISFLNLAAKRTCQTGPLFVFICIKRERP